jgi:asparagine synthase (glutamine-hydrolysing)
MCGLGVLLTKTVCSDSLKFVEQDISKMISRGPDAQISSIINSRVIAGHTRLAINGLSEDYNQPFSTDDEHFLVFNGEIYNFREANPQLQCDTVYLYDKLVSANGDLTIINNFLGDFDGVWAFAFISSRYVIVSRDIFGEKPLYRHTSRNNGAVYFSSVATCDDRKNFESRAFPANTVTKIELENFENEISFNIINHNKVITNHGDNDFQSGFEALLRASIKTRVNCDVPVACTLSGGLDSSAIALLATQTAASEVTFFTSVPNVGESELMYAKNVTDTLGKKLEVFEYTVEMYFHTLKKNLDTFPLNIKSPSSIVHLMLMEKIREKGFKVCLDGQGADEYLGGYRSQSIEWLLSNFKSTLNMKYLIKLASLLIKEKQVSLYYFVFKKIFIEGVNNRQSIIHQSLFNEPLPSLLSYTDFVSMKHSIEVRTPFLNLDLVNFTRNHKSFDFDYPITKPVLRKILSNNGLELISSRQDKLGYELPWNNLCKLLRSPAGRPYMPNFKLLPVLRKRLLTRYLIFILSLYLMPKIAIFSHFKLTRLLGFNTKT